MAIRRAYLASFDESLLFNQRISAEIVRLEKLIDKRLKIFENIYQNGMIIRILLEPAFPFPWIEVESGLRRKYEEAGWIVEFWGKEQFTEGRYIILR